MFTHYRLSPAEYLPATHLGVRLRVRFGRWHWFFEVGQ
jgi:hypothetical protein